MSGPPPRDLMAVLIDAATQRDAVTAIVEGAKTGAAEALGAVGISRSLVHALTLDQLVEVVAGLRHARQAAASSAGLPLRAEDLDVLEVALGASRAAPEIVRGAGDVVNIIRQLVTPRSSGVGVSTQIMPAPPAAKDLRGPSTQP